jgi:hypothetical protein
VGIIGSTVFSCNKRNVSETRSVRPLGKYELNSAELHPAGTAILSVWVAQMA